MGVKDKAQYFLTPTKKVATRAFQALQALEKKISSKKTKIQFFTKITTCCTLFTLFQNFDENLKK